MFSLPHHHAVRYVVPLREGGSLPAIVETEGGEQFVTKFRGAGQGARVLIAELISGLLARHLELPVPDLAFVHLDPSFGRTERDPEIQDILKGSRGTNVGLRYLDGAFNYDDVAGAAYLSPRLAADIVWFDAFITNIDRTPKNPNLMIWQEQLYLIDHGAALYFHYNWPGVDADRARAPFSMIKDHVLLPLAGPLRDADERLSARLGADVFRAVLDAVPDTLLMDAPAGHEPPFASAEENRTAYVDYLTTRLTAPHAFVDAAIEGQDALSRSTPRPLRYRR